MKILFFPVLTCTSTLEPFMWIISYFFNQSILIFKLLFNGIILIYNFINVIFHFFILVFNISITISYEFFNFVIAKWQRIFLMIFQVLFYLLLNLVVYFRPFIYFFRSYGILVWNSVLLFWNFVTRLSFKILNFLLLIFKTIFYLVYIICNFFTKFINHFFNVCFLNLCLLNVSDLFLNAFCLQGLLW